MVILHIACITNSPFNGVCVAAKKHFLTQAKYANVAFINVNNEKIDGISNQFTYDENFDINKLESPFNHPDLVVFHECYRIQYINIYKKLLGYNIPYIIIPHGELRIEAQKKKRFKKIVANLLLFNRFIKKSLGLQCLSELEKEKIKFKANKFIGTNGIVIPEKRKEYVEKDHIEFVYIGRYEWKVKGLDILFSAINEIRDFLTENNFHISLYGPDYRGRFEEVKNLIKLNNVEKFVSLNHEVSGSEKEKILLDSDVFIQTSRHEGMPMGILEALSYGIPTLVTRGTTLGNLIIDNKCGWCAENNSKSVSEQITNAIKSKEKFAVLGENARKIVSEKFDWDIISRNTVDYYERLISK